MALYQQTLSLVMIRVGILVGVCIISLFVSSSQANQLAYAEKTISKDKQLLCQEIYPKYKEMGEKEFKIKNSHKRYLEDCLKLYKDPGWTFKGKNIIDKKFEKSNSTTNLPESTSKKVDTKILGKTKIGSDRYFVKFQACSLDSSTNKPRFLIETHLEKFVGIGVKEILPQKCNSFWTQVKTKSPDNILIKFISNDTTIAELEKKPLLYQGGRE